MLSLVCDGVSRFCQSRLRRTGYSNAKMFFENMSYFCRSHQFLEERQEKTRTPNQVFSIERPIREVFSKHDDKTSLPHKEGNWPNNAANQRRCLSKEKECQTQMKGKQDRESTAQHTSSHGQRHHGQGDQTQPKRDRVFFFRVSWLRRHRKGGCMATLDGVGGGTGRLPMGAAATMNEPSTRVGTAYGAPRSQKPAHQD